MQIINNKYRREAIFDIPLNESDGDNREIHFFLNHNNGQYCAGLYLQRIKKQDGYSTCEYNPFDIISAVIAEGRFSIKKLEEYAKKYESSVCDSTIKDYLSTNTTDKEERLLFARKHLFTILNK